MPRPRTQTAPLHVSPGQASYVLDRLVAERRISQGEVNRYVADMQREISDLEHRLASLREATGAAAPAAARAQGWRGAASRAAAPAAPAGPAKAGRRRRKTIITPEQLASRQLQGRYLGLIRQIPSSRRAQYQKIAREKGREAAIKEMQSVLKK